MWSSISNHDSCLKMRLKAWGSKARPYSTKHLFNEYSGKLQLPSLHWWIFIYTQDICHKLDQKANEKNSVGSDTHSSISLSRTLLLCALVSAQWSKKYQKFTENCFDFDKTRANLTHLTWTTLPNPPNLTLPTSYLQEIGVWKHFMPKKIVKIEEMVSSTTSTIFCSKAHILITVYISSAVRLQLTN